MPRTKNDPRNHKYRKLVCLINGYVAAEGRTQRELADILGVHFNTMARRLRNPEDMSAKDLAKLGRTLHIPIEELRDCAIVY